MSRRRTVEPSGSATSVSAIVAGSTLIRQGRPLHDTHGVPSAATFLSAGAWALAVAAIGFLFFISRERDFAVRLT